jgi:circadian clock protein KaiB
VAAGERAPLAPMTRHRFTLYVAGDTARSQQAHASLRRICAQALGDGEWEVALVDVTRQPDAAERERILTTPTVVKEAPEPRRRITGDLSDAGKVLTGLGMLSGWPDPLSRTEA